MASPGEFLIAEITGAAALGFVPVAIHFNLFSTLAKLDKPISAAEFVEAVSKDESIKSPLNNQLAEDILFIMTGIGLLDMVENKYQPNLITKHMAAVPSSTHGALHFTLEPLMASAFIYPKLVDSNFAYPFKEAAVPFQYAYEKMGNTKFAHQHMYSIMHDQNRLESFNFFMEGKFGVSTTMPVRVRSLGYDLDSLMVDQGGKVIVDIGGGQGQLLLELKAEYPQLKSSNLILQEFNADASPREGISGMDWDFKGSEPQSVIGADIYNVMHICHNTPDIESIQLLQKISAAMKPKSRLFIQEFSKSFSNANMHATMIALLGGRERSSQEWKAMAGISGLKVTFEAYPEKGEGLIEMMKI